MKKAFISTVSLALIFATALSFASCNGDDDITKENTSTPTTSTQATEKQTEKATDAQTDTYDESEPADDSATNAIVTEVTVTDAPETKQPQIIVQTTKAPETSAPIEDTTKTPETQAPAEDTTTEVTTKPEEDTKAPATTAPGQDPNVDYSQWGKHGFENLLPIPLPYSDEEADWNSRKFSGTVYDVRNEKWVDDDSFIRTFAAYVKQYESLGYTVGADGINFYAESQDTSFRFQCSSGFVVVFMYF